MRNELLIGVVVALLATPALGTDLYYYSSQQQIPLQLDTFHILVKCDGQLSPNQGEEFLMTLTRVVSASEPPQVAEGFLLCSLSVGTGYASYLDSVQGADGVYLAEPVYRDTIAGPAYIGDVFIAAFGQGVIREQVDSINLIFNVTLDHQYEGLDNTFILRNTDSTGLSTTDLANRYYELPETEWSHPMFTSVIEKHAYQILDHYAPYQTHSKKVIGQFNQASVWDFAGLRRPVTVAVVDDGIAAHDDLPVSRILPGKDFYAHASLPREDNDPSPGTLQAHGMGCAGIIAASHSDSIGYDTMLDHSYIFGIAPEALIRPVKIFGDDGTSPTDYIDDTVLSRAIQYARQNADILSNSWGFGRPYWQKDMLTAELMNAADLGRGGKGCIIVFSSGNSASFDWTVQYPANLPVCFSVGASDLTDHRWAYSQAGPGLGVVAPSGQTCFYGDVWSLDQMDYNGFNPDFTYACKHAITWDCPPNWQNDNNLDCHFGGTSAAAPMVAGVAALLLSRDSMLTREQVYEILRRSAVTQFSWGSITPPDFDLGWGRVDAFRAVLSIAHGDVNNDGFVADLSDLSALIAYLNNPAQKPFPSVRLGDWNCSGGAVDLTDLSLCIAWVTGQQGRVLPVKPCFKY